MNITAVPPLRRIGVCLLATALAAFLFRGPIAEGIATRGDVEFQNGRAERALKFYGRAARYDIGSNVAVERLTTLAFMSGNKHLMTRAAEFADAHLAVRPNDAAVLQNLAFIERKLGRVADSDRDFARVASLTPDANVVEFSARRALARGDRRTAIDLYHRALALDPNRPSARAALARLEPRV